MMLRRALLVTGAAFVAGCVRSTGPSIGPDGQPLPQRYDFPPPETVQFRMLDAVNALRSARGAPPLRYNAQLNAAAVTHARDMALQDRPWHFGSDGSSPFDRVRRVGYGGRLVGEAIAETFETELETLGAWMEDPTVRPIILDDSATDMGFGWVQQRSGRIWWTLLTGAASGAEA